MALLKPNFLSNCQQKIGQKELESMIFFFIWGKSLNVARVDAKKPKTEGGLNMPLI